MKRLLITILLFTFFSNVNSQILQMRVLTVENQDIAEFESAVAKKLRCIMGKEPKKSILPSKF